MTKRRVRQQAIIARVQAAGAYAVRDLAQELKVSEETIRRELKVLEASGAISKAHGAVSLPLGVTEGPFELRLRGERGSQAAHRPSRRRSGSGTAALSISTAARRAITSPRRCASTGP
jgi:DeoR family glycerol-3-phosphate regulon repressor